MYPCSLAQVLSVMKFTLTLFTTYLFLDICCRDVKHKRVIVASLLLLRLLHQSLPFLKSSIRDLTADSSDKAAFQKVWMFNC